LRAHFPPSLSLSSLSPLFFLPSRAFPQPPLLSFSAGSAGWRRRGEGLGPSFSSVDPPVIASFMACLGISASDWRLRCRTRSGVVFVLNGVHLQVGLIFLSRNNLPCSDLVRSVPFSCDLGIMLPDSGLVYFPNKIPRLSISSCSSDVHLHHLLLRWLLVSCSLYHLSQSVFNFSAFCSISWRFKRVSLGPLHGSSIILLALVPFLAGDGFPFIICAGGRLIFVVILFCNLLLPLSTSISEARLAALGSDESLMRIAVVLDPQIGDLCPSMRTLGANACSSTESMALADSLSKFAVGACAQTSSPASSFSSSGNLDGLCGGSFSRWLFYLLVASFGSGSSPTTSALVGNGAEAWTRGNPYSLAGRVSFMLRCWTRVPRRLCCNFSFICAFNLYRVVILWAFWSLVF
jgi:hypothetical protein